MLNKYEVKSNGLFQVASSTTETSPSSSEYVYVTIDDALGIDTVMTSTWSQNSLITVSVHSPVGEVINSTDPRYSLDDVAKIITIRIDDAVVNFDRGVDPGGGGGGGSGCPPPPRMKILWGGGTYLFAPPPNNFDNLKT